MQDIITISQDQLFIYALITLWVLPWKGYALWKASQNKDKMWFIAIFLINSFAILEALYIFYFSNKKDEKSGI